LTQYRSN